jgi:hypothetical protein
MPDPSDLGLPVLGDAEGTSSMRHALFFYISPKNPTPPGAYYLHATVRSGKAQQVGVVFRLVGENAMPPSEVKIWVNGQPSSFELSRGLVAVPLEAGENTILLKIRQDERVRSGGERLKLTLGDPIFGVPNLTDIDWKALDGSWVPVNPPRP